MKKLVFLFFLVIGKAEAQSVSALAVADSLYVLGNYHKAISYYEEVSGTDLKIAKSYEALGQNGKALERYQSIVEKDTHQIIALYLYGKLLLKVRRLAEADAVFDKLIKSDSTNATYYFQKGLIKEKQGDSTSITFFKKAYQKNPNYQDALYKLAKFNTEKRRFTVGKEYIDIGLLANPNSIRFLNLQALALFYTKEYHGALGAYQKLVSLNEHHLQLHENLAVSYRNTNQFEKAIDQYSLLITEYDDKSPKYHFELGKTYLALRDYEKAQEHMERSIQLLEIPIDSNYMTLAQLFGVQKKYKEQMEALKKAIEENPKNQRAQYFLATAADNYFKDKSSVIRFYEQYLNNFGEKGKYSNYALQRIKDLKTEMHFTKE